jgi:hypothetical protein
MRLTHPVSVTPATNSKSVKNRFMGQEFAVFFFKRELDEFLKDIDAEHEVVAAQYEKLVASVKSGFGGAVKLTRELVTAFGSHIDERCNEEEEPETLRFVPESYVSQQQWLDCLVGDLGRIRFIADPRSLKKVNVRIRDSVSRSEYQINTTTKFRKVFKQHCTRKSLQEDAVSFVHNGEVIDPDKSPVELYMEDMEDTVEFYMMFNPTSEAAMNLHVFNVRALSIFIKCVDTVRHSLDLDGKFATTVRALTQKQFDELIDLIHKKLNLHGAEVDGNLDTEPDAYMDEMGNPWDQSITRAVYAFANIDYYDP